jgi:hypothetical protein
VKKACESPLTGLLMLTAVLALIGPDPVRAVSVDYRVQKVRVFADGQWQDAKKKTDKEFLVEYKPSWPKALKIEVTWYPFFDHTYFRSPICDDSLDKIHIKLNGQPMPGHPSGLQLSSNFMYVFQNVPRSAPAKIFAGCYWKQAENLIHTGGGGATINFRPADPLAGWNPGLPVTAADFEIYRPREGSALQTTEPMEISVISKLSYVAEQPVKLGFEIEKAMDVQTGVVGDVALPGNKPYATQWKLLKKFWRDASWSGNPQGNKVDAFRLTGSLSENHVRGIQHQPGLYRIRVLLPSGPPTQWRTFWVRSLFQPIR